MTSEGTIEPIGIGPGGGEALWVFGVLATVKASGAATGGRVSVIEHLAAKGAGSPLHVHRNEDEWFYVIEGNVAFWVGGKVIDAPAGSFVYGPRGIPHTFLVTSEQARFLLVAEPGGFDAFMRALSQPAGSLTPPPADLAMPAPEIIGAAASRFGIEILGPPGLPSA